MDANLVRTAGVKLNFDEGGGIDAREDAPVRAGRARIRKGGCAAGGHAIAADGIAGDGQLDAAALFGEHALDEGDIGFLDAAFAKRLREEAVGEIVFRDEENARGFLVNAMNDAGAEGVATLRKGLAAAEQGVDEGPVGVPCPGVDGHAGGFVDGEEVVVFVENFEGDFFGFGLERGTLGGNYFDEIVCVDFLGVFGRACR